MNANIPRIQHNIVAMNAYRNYSANSKKLTGSIEKLSSGYRINRAGDDAAGLAISEKMRAQISGLTQAKKNANDGINLIQTAEGAMTEVHDMLNRMTTLAEQSANGTYDDEVDRVQLQKEVDSLKSEINRIADSTNYNGIKLLDGSLSASTETKTDKAEWSFDTYNVDATKTTQKVELANTLASGTGARTTVNDGDVFTFDVGLNDGTSMKINLTAKFSDWKDDANANQEVTMSLVDDDGNTVYSANFADTHGSPDVQKTSVTLNDSTTSATEFSIKDLNSALGEAFKNTKLGDAYKITGNATDVSMKARKAGADTVQISSIRQTVADKEGNDITAKMLDSTTGVTNVPASPDQLVQLTTVDGKDGYATFKSEDIVLYNDQANDGKGNAEDAVFTINGQKFAIGVRNGGVNGNNNIDNSTVSNLGDDVTFISLDGAAVAKGAAALAGGVNLHDPDDAFGDNATTEYVQFDKAALNQITSEISKKLGVEVTYEAADWDTANGNVSKQLEDEDPILSGTDYTNNQGQGFFKVASKVTEGTVGKSLTLQIGDTSDDFNKLSVNISDLHSAAIGIGDVDISTQEGAAKAMDSIKAAVNYVSDVRGSLGALQNRLDHTINNLGVMTENIQAAEGAIRDTDVAEEMMNYTKTNILNQAAQAMLAQANQLPQGVLQLIG